MIGQSDDKAGWMNLAVVSNYRLQPPKFDGPP